MQCSHCQHESSGGARFCPRCGSILEGSCPACSAKAEAGDRFCAACGRGLSLSLDLTRLLEGSLGLERLQEEIRALREGQNRLLELVAELQKGLATPKEAPSIERAKETPRAEPRDEVPIPLPDTQPSSPEPRRTERRRKPLRLGVQGTRRLRAVAVSLVAAGLVIGALSLGIFDRVELVTLNWRFRAKGELPPSRQVALVTIDRETEEHLGPFGKRYRELHGQLLRNLAEDEARAVGFDLAFPTPSEYDGEMVKGILYARERGTEVVLASFYREEDHSLSQTADSLREAVSGIGSAYLKKDPLTNLVRYVYPLQEISHNNEPVVNLIPSLSFELASLMNHGIAPPGGGKQDPVAINFSRFGSFPHFSYSQVYSGEFPPGAFTGRAVLVGVTLEGAKDSYDVPVGPQMPGVEIHAHALSTFLEGEIRRSSPLQTAGMVVFLSLVTSLFYTLLASSLRSMAIVGLFVGYTALAFMLFRLTPPLELNLTYSFAAILGVWVAVSLEEKVRTRAELTRTLGLPAKILKKLERDPDFRYGKAQKPLTIFESDVAGYSAWSKKTPPDQVASMMREYISMAEGVIYRHGGYVNKYIGDAILAVFGYPMAEEEGPWRAVLSAFEIQAGLRELVARWQKEGRSSFTRVRIGINSGVVDISYLGGSKKQLDILGDNVDLAARLEAAAGSYDCVALVSEKVFQAVGDRVEGLRVPVTLKNRPDVKEAYALTRLLVLGVRS